MREQPALIVCSNDAPFENVCHHMPIITPTIDPIASIPANDLMSFVVTVSEPSIIMLGRTNIIADGIQKRFHVLSQLGHKQLIRRTSKEAIQLMPDAMPNLLWYSPKGALSNGESARTDFVEMRSATALLSNQLDAGGDAIITTTKYFASEGLELFLASRKEISDSKPLHVYHTIGHKIFSTIELPKLQHALRATHREDIMMNAVATFILQAYAAHPPAPTTVIRKETTMAHALPWGKQFSTTNSTTTSFDNVTSVPSSSTIMSSLLADGKPISKTKQKLKARRSYKDEQTQELEMLNDINAQRKQTSGEPLKSTAVPHHGNRSVKFQSEYDLGDHATNDDSTNAPPVNHYKEHLKRTKQKIEEHYDDCGEDMSGIPDDLIKANSAVQKFASFFNDDGSTDTGSSRGSDNVESDNEYEHLHIEREFEDPKICFCLFVFSTGKTCSNRCL